MTNESSEDRKLNAYFQKKHEEAVKLFPTWQTHLGLKTNYGKLNNNTEEFDEMIHQKTIETLEELKQFDYSKLNEVSKTSFNIFKLETESRIESRKWRYHFFPLNQMFGYHSTTPSFLINMHQISNVQDAKDYISRLKEVKRVFSENLISLKKQEAKKIYPPKFIYSKVFQDSKNIIFGKPFDQSNKLSPLLQDFQDKITKLKLDKKTHASLLKEAKKALLSHIKPAYLELISYAKKLQKKSKFNRGSWSLPNGGEYYKHRLKEITTTDYTPDQIHKIGLSEVKRIHSEMNEIKKKVGFKGTLLEFFDHMNKDKSNFYPQTKAGREAYLKKSREIIANIKAQLPKMFNTFPKAKLKVRAVEAYREKSAGIAFYNGPSLDGSRPGIYYVNLYKMEDNPKYEMEALAYHEAIPGHHMQIAIASELENLPIFRRTGGVTAFSEGWGLYSEFLPKEYGFYKDPLSDFGRLSMELWRACRLVVDTGLHAKRWSYNKAIKYLQNNTPSGDLEITKAVERYIVMPGQATAYKIGMLKILELRKLSKDALKEKFDIAEFHDVVLKSGSISMKILEKNVRNWIKSKKS